MQWKRRGSLLLIGLAFVIAPFGAVIASGTAAAAGSTCTWTGSGDGTSWSDSGNWSGCGGEPQNGDSLAFDSSGLSTDTFLSNDLSNLQVGSITFSGSGPYGYIINGNAISLNNGILDSAPSNVTGLNLAITLTSNQTFITTSATGTLDVGNSTFNIGSYNLQVGGAGWTQIDAAIVGSGTMAFNGNASAIYLLYGNNSGFSGPVNIAGGTLIINAGYTDPLGTSHVTIANGATLQESINANGTYTVANPITLAGNGANNASYGAGALIVHGYSASGTVNFTGPITLAGNATVGLVGANASITGSVSGCGYNLSTATGASGTLTGTLAGSCGSNPGTNSSNSGITDPSSAPAAPNTGYGRPLGFDPIAAVLVVGSTITMGTGLAVIYCQPRNHKHP
ncbi:MAG TPA: hypothetical protein VHB72_02205 [Candidatus Saccharimonadales bacterium]|nr:hypothetical protein [Candidatus Saccharimonadales bacterium]